MADSKPQTLAGKLAIVSGSSKGLGAAIALELASRSVILSRHLLKTRVTENGIQQLYLIIDSLLQGSIGRHQLPLRQPQGRG